MTEIHIVHWPDGPKIEGVFSDKAQAALWNYEQSLHATITTFELDALVKKPEVQPPHRVGFVALCRDCKRALKFGEDEIHWETAHVGVGGSASLVTEYRCRKCFNVHEASKR